MKPKTLALVGFSIIFLLGIYLYAKKENLIGNLPSSSIENSTQNSN